MNSGARYTEAMRKGLIWVVAVLLAAGGIPLAGLRHDCAMSQAQGLSGCACCAHEEEAVPPCCAAEERGPVLDRAPCCSEHWEEGEPLPPTLLAKGLDALNQAVFPVVSEYAFEPSLPVLASETGPAGPSPGPPLHLLNLRFRC